MLLKGPELLPKPVYYLFIVGLPALNGIVFFVRSQGHNIRIKL